MSKWIRQIDHGKTSSRITIPKYLVEKMNLAGTKYIEFDDSVAGQITIRRLSLGQKTNGNGPNDPIKID